MCSPASLQSRLIAVISYQPIPLSAQDGSAPFSNKRKSNCIDNIVSRRERYHDEMNRDRVFSFTLVVFTSNDGIRRLAHILLTSIAVDLLHSVRVCNVLATAGMPFRYQMMRAASTRASPHFNTPDGSPDPTRARLRCYSDFVKNQTIISSSYGSLVIIMLTVNLHIC